MKKLLNTDDLKRQARELRRENKTLRTIAATLSVSVGTVRNLLNPSIRKRTFDDYLRGLERRHKLARGDARKLLIDQNFSCAICRVKLVDKNITTPPRTKLALDHSPRTFRVRGFLCWRCNLRLQRVDTPERLRAYVSHHRRALRAHQDALRWTQKALRYLENLKGI